MTPGGGLAGAYVQVWEAADCEVLAPLATTDFCTWPVLYKTCRKSEQSFQRWRVQVRGVSLAQQITALQGCALVDTRCVFAAHSQAVREHGSLNTIQLSAPEASFLRKVKQWTRASPQLQTQTRLWTCDNPFVARWQWQWHTQWRCSNVNSRTPGPTDMSDGAMFTEKNSVNLLSSCSVSKRHYLVQTVDDSDWDMDSEFQKFLKQSKRKMWKFIQLSDWWILGFLRKKKKAQGLERSVAGSRVQKTRFMFFSPSLVHPLSYLRRPLLHRWINENVNVFASPELDAVTKDNWRTLILYTSVELVILVVGCSFAVLLQYWLSQQFLLYFFMFPYFFGLLPLWSRYRCSSSRFLLFLRFRQAWRSGWCHPSLLSWPSYFSACFCFNPRSRVPRCCFFCPSFFRVRSNSHCQSPLHLPLCFNPTWNVGGPHLVLCVSCVSFDFFRHIFPLQLLPCARFHLSHSGRMRRCLEHILYSCCLLRPSRLSYFVNFLHLLPILCRSLILCRLFFLGVFRLALSLRLNDETEHLALRRTNQFLVFDCAHVPEPYVNVGVMIMLNTRSLCRRRWYLDVNSCLYLENDAHAALILLYISVVSCCSNVMVCPKYFAFSLIGKSSTLMSSIVALDCLLDLWLVRFFRMDLHPCTFGAPSEVSRHYFQLVQRCGKWKARRQEISSWTGNQFSGHPNWCPCLFLRLLFKSSSTAAWSTVLNKKELESLPVSSLFISWTYRSPYLPRLWLVGLMLMYGAWTSNLPKAFHSALWRVVSNAIAKTTVAIRILRRHSRHFCSDKLYVASWSSVCNERRNPPWSRGCLLSSLL